MKKLLALLLVSIIASVAQAEQLPPGCYVADYYRTDECWGETGVSFFEWPDFYAVGESFTDQTYALVPS